MRSRTGRVLIRFSVIISGISLRSTPGFLCLDEITADPDLIVAYYVAFGPHGPRRPTPPDEGRKVFFLTAGVIAAAVALFSVTRLFANPVRPRTMTKEWQEATEEYMKVCRTNFTQGPLLPLREYKLIPIPVGTKNGAYYFQAWYDGPEQVREASACSREAQRRVNVRPYDCVIQTLPIPIPLFLGSTFHLVLFVCYMSDHASCELGLKESFLGKYCVNSSPVYRILEALPVASILSFILRVLP